MADFEENSISFGENISGGSEQRVQYEKPRFNSQTQESGESLFRPDVFGNIPVEVTVQMGKSKISLKEVMELSKGSVIELSKVAGEPLDLLVNGQLIGRGEVVAIDDNYGIRVTEVIHQPSQAG